MASNEPMEVRRRKSARSTGRRSRSTEPLPGVQAFRRLRRMSSRARISGAEPAAGMAARPAATIIVLVSRRAAFPGEGACRRVASALVSATRASTLPSRLAKPALTSVPTRVAFAGGAFRRRSPAASKPLVERVERTCNRGRLLRAGQDFRGAAGSLASALFPAARPCRRGNCRLLVAPGDAARDRPAAADFLTVPARRPTLFG